MSTYFLTIRGDQLGTFTGLSGNGNGTERVVTLTGTAPYGTASQIYTIRIDNAAPGATQFTNGQTITITGPSGNVVMGPLTAQPDIEQGLGAGDEHIIFQSAGFFINLTGVSAGTMAFGHPSQAAMADFGDNDGELDFADTRADFPCFASGTRIATPAGPRPVEDLAAGDFVLDVSGQSHRLVWRGERDIALDRPDHPQRPVLLRPGCLPGLSADLVVSPQHRMLVRLPEGQEFLVPAKALLSWRGVRSAMGRRQVTYHALLCARHVVLLANGAAAESFYPGRQIMACLPSFQRLQILALLPGLTGDPGRSYGPTARPVLRVSAARRLLERLAPAAAPGRLVTSGT